MEVHNPIAGTWTAVIFTVSNAPYFGPVQFSYSTQQFHSAGSVSPSSLTLAPGQSGTFQVTVTAGQAGDEALKLHLGTGGSTDGSIPIILRALVPITSSGGSFSGTLTGGGATRSTPARSSPTSSTCRRDKPSLNVGVQLADPDYGARRVPGRPERRAAGRQTTANDSSRPRPDHAVLPRLTGTRPVDPGPAASRCRSTART